MTSVFFCSTSRTNRGHTGGGYTAVHKKIGVPVGEVKNGVDAGRLMAQLASAFSHCCMPQLGLSHMRHGELGVRGVSSVVCYAVLCPSSGGLCGSLFRVMPWSSVLSSKYTAK